MAPLPRSSLPHSQHLSTSTQTNVDVLGENYLLPGDDRGGHSLYLTRKEHLSPSDIVNISRWHKDHRSWEKTKEQPFTLAGQEPNPGL